MAAVTHVGSDPVPADPSPARWHRVVLLFFFAVWVAAAVANFVFPPMAPRSRAAWLEGWTMALWCLGAITLVTSWARRIPVQNVIAVTVLSGGIGWFTGFATSRSPGVDLHPVLLLIVMGLGNRGFARWILRRHRGRGDFGAWVMALGIGSSLVILMLPVVRTGVSWILPQDVGSVLAWIVALVVVHLVSTPWLMDKRVTVPATDGCPAVVMTLLTAWNVVFPVGLEWTLIQR